MNKKDAILVSLMTIIGAVFSDQGFKFAIGLDDFLKIENTEWVRWGLTSGSAMSFSSVLTGVFIFLLAALSIYKIVDFVRKGKFVLVLALNFIAGGLVSMLVDVLFFGGVRHWVFFFGSIGFAIADFFVVTGVLLFLLISRIPSDQFLETNVH